MVLCLCRMIIAEGIDRLDFMKFKGCNVPGESQEQATTWLQSQMRDRLQCCIELETLIREGHKEPLLASGQIFVDTDHLANIVQPSAADLVDQAIRATALLIRCTRRKVPLWSLELMSGSCIAQILKVTELLKNKCNMQQECLNSLRLFFNYIMHRWFMHCEVICFSANVQALLICYQLEMDMRLQVMIASILEEAQKRGHVADQMAAWVHINEQGLRQRYVQKLEEECSSGVVLFTKGDIIMLIKRAGDFFWEGILFDSDYNLGKMVDMQDEVLERRKGTFMHLYRGLVLPEYAVDGGPGTPNQLLKFYVPVPILSTVEGLDHNKLDTLFKHHFKYGMSRFELDQFLIQLSCKVDLTKFNCQLLQRWECGMQQGELSTARRGVMLDQQQILAWHSWSEARWGMRCRLCPDMVASTSALRLM